VTVKKAKPVVLFGATEDILHFLWCCDEHDYAPRMRLQLTWILTVMSHAGFRTGEVLESVDWRGSNEGILYKDVDLYIVRFNGRLSFHMNVRLRNRKGQRGQEATYISHAARLPL
jgi:hypothetical protein